MRSLVFVVGALFVSCTYPDVGFVRDAPSPIDEDTDSASRTDSTTATDTTAPDSSELPDGACACPASERCVAAACVPHASCAALHTAVPALGSGVYRLDPDGDGAIAPFETYCEMVADGGGWTLAMKLDGANKTFAYESPLWTNSEDLNPTSTAVDTVEAKLPSFWTMPFTSLRLGMLDGTRRYIRVELSAPSLRALFAAGPVTTTAGRAEWMKLLAAPQLQTNCDAEGVNRDFTASAPYASRARLGTFGNNEADCASPDSYIGFGAGFITPHECVGAEPGIVVGNFNPTSCGNTAAVARTTAAFGYIFLR